MARIELSKPAREAAARGLAKYLKDELEVEVTGFDVQFLLDFVAEQVGPYFYNQGLADAQAIVAARMEAVAEAIWELEKPVTA
jgi:uncharacterized protein (DUF2164 family)